MLSFSSGLQTILDGIKIDSRANGELTFLGNPDFLAGSDFLQGHHEEGAEKNLGIRLVGRGEGY